MGALDGILVIALEQAVAAPLCTVRLADAGARVIKIEREGGETARHYDDAVAGRSTYFTWLNRGKESAVLDLKSEDGFGLFLRMLARADVLVQNLVPGAMDRMGLSPSELQGRFPRLISVSIAGYGRDTAYADMRAYDLLVQVESGVCALTGTPETPSKVGVPVADIGAGTNAHAAVLEALIERGSTGRGRAIEISMFDAMADWMSVPLLHYEHGGHEAGRHGLSHAAISPYRPFTCKDGTFILAVQTQREWQALCRDVVQRPDLLERPEFTTNPLRLDNKAALDAELEPIFAAHSVADAIGRCKSAGIAWGRLSELRDLNAHPALRQVQIDLDDGTRINLPRPAGRDAAFAPGPVPALGQHTDSIRQEFSDD